MDRLRNRLWERLAKHRAALAQAAFIVSMAALFAHVSLWIVFEQDIFWQVRAGEELWRTHAFPWTDTWSYSARGAPWQNIQWLSTLGLYGAYEAGANAADDVAGLIRARGATVGALFLLVGSIVALRARRVGNHLQAATPWLLRPSASLTLMALLPCLYVTLVPRLQLRSDVFVLVVFSALVAFWQSALGHTCKRIASVAAVCVAANLHAGTAPFVVALAVAHTVASSERWRVAAGWGAACAAAFFATPYTWHVLPTLYEHLFYDAFNQLKNTDHLPLSWQYFLPSQSMWGWSGIAWLALCLAAAKHASAKSAQRGWALAAALCVLTALSINRERSIPYHAVFVLPFAAAALAKMPRVAVAGLAVCAWLGWSVSVRSMAPMRGAGVHMALYPVGCAKFIERAQPQGNVFHTFALGAYLVWYMRDRPLYVDTRETMYRPLQSEVIASFHSPQITQALLRKYDAHTVVMPIPPTRYVPGEGFEDVIARYLPHERWALVYFDAAAFVMVERIPEHAALIAEHEYALLRPNLPANLYALAGDRNRERDLAFAQEINRCLRDEPDNVYCTVANAAFQRDSHAPIAVRQSAVETLELAVRRAERWNSAQWTHAMVELHRAYEDMGDKNRARAIEARVQAWNGKAAS